MRTQTWSLAREWSFVSDINALFTKFDRIFLELQTAPVLHVTIACSRDNAVSFRGKISKNYRGFWGREPSKWNFRKFATNSNRYNSKPEIDFVTISTAFKKVWGTLNMPLKIFGQGALEGKGSNSQKKKVYNEQRNFFGTLTSFISRHNREHFLHLPTRYSRQNIVSTCAKFLKSGRDGPPKLAQNENFKSL